MVGDVNHQPFFLKNQKLSFVLFVVIVVIIVVVSVFLIFVSVFVLKIFLIHFRILLKINDTDVSLYKPTELIGLQ